MRASYHFPFVRKVCSFRTERFYSFAYTVQKSFVSALFFCELLFFRLLGVDLRTLLRGGVTDEALRVVLAEAIAGKPRRHGFQEQVADAESRRMNEIGG